MDEVTVALVQEPPVFLNRARTARRALTLIDELAARAVDVIVFPETWLPGYPVWLDLAPGAAMWDAPGARNLFRALCDQSVALGDETISRLHEAARQHEVHVVIGAHELAGNTLYNTTFFLGGDHIAHHRKLTPTYNERLIWGVGDGSTLATVGTRFGTLGGLICWEHWLPLARAAMHAKKETLHVAQWPAVGEIHQLASRHYAFEGTCFVAASGCILARGDLLSDPIGLDASGVAMLASIPGDEATLVRDGGSAVIGPDGQYLAGPDFESRETLIATCDLSRIAEARLLLDTDGHYARPDVFQLTVDARAKTNVRFTVGDP